MCNFLKVFLYFMCTALPVYVSVYCVHTWYTQKSEESLGSPGTSVKDGCASPCGALETEPGFSRAAVLLTTEPLSSLQKYLENPFLDEVNEIAFWEKRSDSQST